MKKIIIFSTLFVCLSTVSQNVFTVDWGKAPVNPLYFGYTLNHRNLTGDIKNVSYYSNDRQLSDEMIFDKTGKLTSHDLIMWVDYYSYKNGKLITIDDFMGTYTITLDNQGRILKYVSLGNTTEYSYNNKGLLVKDIYNGQLKDLFEYDSQGRVVNRKSYDTNGKLTSETSYTYSISGGNTVVTISYKSGSNVTSKTNTYNNKGHIAGTQYDKKGNPISDNNGYWIIQYWDGTVSNGGNTNTSGSGNSSSISTVQQPNTTSANTTQIVNNTTTGCVYGDCQNGWGKMQYENGYYEGFFSNGNRHGYGMYAWKTEGTYIGFYVNNVIEGYGSYENKNGKIVAGMYANGMANGLAEEVENGQWKQGFYTNHSLTTPYDYTNHYKDYGCKAGDCQNGYGQYKWENGDIFSGFFKNGKLHLGSYTFANGDLYKGMFNSNGQFHGQGRFFYKSGAYYGGEFSNGNFNGKGYYSDAGKKRKVGEWQNGNLIKTYLKD